MQITEQQYDTVLNGLRTQLEILRARALELDASNKRFAEREQRLEKLLGDRTELILLQKQAMSQLDEVHFSPHRDKKKQALKELQARVSFVDAIGEFHRQGFATIK